MTDISFPSSLKQVGDYAFYHCQKIAKLDLKKNRRSR
ncbi:MAG: leucine-rich repeat protein [Prevotella sp.]|nr:leucine-rich repeat protein [Prevotella sp.]